MRILLFSRFVCVLLLVLRFQGYNSVLCFILIARAAREWKPNSAVISRRKS